MAMALAAGAGATMNLVPVLGLFYVLIFVGVLWLAYMTTRWVSRGYSQTYGKQIRMIDRLPAGVDRSFMIVCVGDQHYFLFMDRNGVKMLDKLNDYQPPEGMKPSRPLSFQELFERLKMKSSEKIKDEVHD